MSETTTTQAPAAPTPATPATPTAPSRAAQAAVAVPGEFPLKAHEYVATLKGTADEVWSKLILMRHKHGAHTREKWAEHHENLRMEPVAPAEG